MLNKLELISYNPDLEKPRFYKKSVFDIRWGDVVNFISLLDKQIKNNKGDTITPFSQFINREVISEKEVGTLFLMFFSDDNLKMEMDFFLNELFDGIDPDDFEYFDHTVYISVFVKFAMIMMDWSNKYFINDNKNEALESESDENEENKNATMTSVFIDLTKTLSFALNTGYDKSLNIRAVTMLKVIGNMIDKGKEKEYETLAEVKKQLMEGATWKSKKAIDKNGNIVTVNNMNSGHKEWGGK